MAEVGAFDAVVVGAGLMGAAAAWSLTRRGRSVLVVEQFQPRHDRGSSHGSARIVRRAYGDALYTRLTGQAFELWRELETASGAEVIRPYGGLDFGPDRDVASIASHLAEAAVPHEVLPATEAERRWPGLRFEGEVLFHPQAGVLDAASAVDAFLGAADAVVRFGVAATSITTNGTGVDVQLSDGTAVRSRTVVVAAGGWVREVIGTLIALPPLRVTEQTVVHFPRHDPQAAPWPTVIHDARGHAVYHLAGGRDGGTGDDRKVGLHAEGPTTTADGRSAQPDAELRARLVEYVRDWLPGLDPTPRGETTCLYTMTPSEDFLLDRVGPVIVCSPCSGHGAKFAPLVGEWVADLVDGSGVPPERFQLSAHRVGAGGSVSL